MVRRLKSDLKALGEKFPDRVVEEIVIDGLPKAAPELELARLLSEYPIAARATAGRAAARASRAQARIVFSGLQQRLLSSIPAFLRTPRKPIERRWQRHVETAETTTEAAGLEENRPAVCLRGVDTPDDLAEEQDAEIAGDETAGRDRGRGGNGTRDDRRSCKNPQE
ncbi:MAG: hypothetical protein WDN31_00765 [Hyphomicrobium sp.]